MTLEPWAQGIHNVSFWKVMTFSPPKCSCQCWKEGHSRKWRNPSGYYSLNNCSIALIYIKWVYIFIRQNQLWFPALPLYQLGDIGQVYWPVTPLASSSVEMETWNFLQGCEESVRSWQAKPTGPQVHPLLPLPTSTCPPGACCSQSTVLNQTQPPLPSIKLIQSIPNTKRCFSCFLF